MRCGTLQFGCSLVRCSSVDRVEHVHARDHNNYYGFDIDFEMRARTGIVQILANSGFLFKLCGRHPTV